ncbi:MAG: hypothetical protein K0U29_01900 [Gammaproteobacteria bacterium]|nr:hypothetical protein [Gammaproteobacteria bacterium]MCH9743663.1 hypothetical protein [Gammaproteobacteria bacterium]
MSEANVGFWKALPAIGVGSICGVYATLGHDAYLEGRIETAVYDAADGLIWSVLYAGYAMSQPERATLLSLAVISALSVVLYVSVFDATQVLLEDAAARATAPSGP